MGLLHFVGVQDGAHHDHLAHYVLIESAAVYIRVSA
jgi:hypothetical protein